MKKLFNFKILSTQDLFSKISRSIFFLFSILYILHSASPATALTSVTTSSVGNVRSGLIGHWTFDGKNMTNATATDTGGGGNNGTLVNMTTASAATRGKIGQALQLNGSNQYITHLPPFQSVNAFSYSIWVKNTNVNADFAGYWEAVSNKQFFFRNSTARFYVRNASDTAEAFATWGSAITDGKWHHVVGVADGTNLQAYLDGVPGTKTALSGPYLQSASIKWQIGNGYQDGLVTGAVDDARAYNRALTASEVQALYKAGGGTIAAVSPGKSSNGSNTTGINSGLVGHWTFDGNNLTNATATDMSGSGAHGRLTNMTATSSKTLGKVGQALTFDGVNDYIEVGSGKYSFTKTTPFSGSAWVKISSTSSQMIMSNYQYLSDPGWHLFVSPAYARGKVVFGLTDAISSGRFVYGSTTVTDGLWHHVSFSYDGSNTAAGIKLYVDGRAEALTVNSDTDPGNLYDASFIIGSVYGSTSYLKGAIDDVRLYNRTITPLEVQSLYKSGGGAVTATSPTNNNRTGINAGLVGYWNFDGKNMTNTTALDVSDNGNTGTLTSMTRSSSATMGKIGQALRFNGVDQTIQIPNSASINPNTITISAWIKVTSGGTFASILSKDNSGFGNRVWQFRKESDGTVTFLVFRDSDSTNNQAQSSVSIDDGKWHFVTGTWDGSTVTVYVDGVQNGYTNAFTGILKQGQSNDAYIGKIETGTPGFFPGMMDEIRIYNRALSASEVLSLYRLGSQR